MTCPLSTCDYDHVIVIDSQVVLEAKPLDQLPWADLFPGSVLLLVTRQVQSEIDAKKNDGRLGKRARDFNKLLEPFIETRTPASILGSPRIDVATLTNGPIDWALLDDLDRDDGDDRIVAQMINARVDDPARLVLLSHDMRPRDAARTHGLSAVRLPETWLREPDASPAARRIAELQERVRLLSVDQPQLSVRVELVGAGSWLYREVASGTPEQLLTLLERKLASAPAPRRSGRFDISFSSHDPTHADRLDAWETMMRQDIPLVHLGLSKLFAQHRLLITVENVGTVSAEDISIEIRSGNTRLHPSPYFVLIAGADAPQPRELYERISPFNPRDLISPRREPFTFYWEERGPGDHIIQSCASFRQGKVHQVEISVELLPSTSAKAQVGAVVTAANMKGDTRDQLLVDVERVVTPFDEMFDAERALPKIALPFDWPEDADSGDFTWYRNGGQEYDPD